MSLEFELLLLECSHGTLYSNHHPKGISKLFMTETRNKN
jgi:hypothetical protein